MHFDPAQPHNALFDLPPLADIESRALLKACIEARAALSELKGMCARFSNPKVLINTIPLLEAQGSSEIENIVTTSDALFRYVEAVAHYQFEAIHPFLDGNGRTGRVLNLLLLVHYGLLDTPVLYLSRYILANRAEYYARLLAVTSEGAWESWIAFILQAITDTALWTSAKITATVDLQTAATEFIRQHARKIYSRELVDIIFQQPYCRIQNLVDAEIAKRQTASAYLKELAGLGVLQEIKVGRELLFIHPNFVRLLTSDEHQRAEYGES